MPPTIQVNASSIDLTFEGVTNRFSLITDTENPNRPLVVMKIERLGYGPANPHRYWITDSGQRVACNSPGVDPNICAVDVNDRITEG